MARLAATGSKHFKCFISFLLLAGAYCNRGGFREGSRRALDPSLSKIITSNLTFVKCEFQAQTQIMIAGNL